MSLDDIPDYEELCPYRACEQCGALFRDGQTPGNRYCPGCRRKIIRHLEVVRYLDRPRRDPRRGPHH
jgi:hypothetical protein